MGSETTDTSDADDSRPPLSEDATATIKRHIEDEHGYLSWLHTQVEAVERGRIALSIPFDEKLTNRDGVTIHGGVAATLIDTAGGVAQQTLFDDPQSGGVATVNLNTNYLRPATGDLYAEAEVIRAGRSIGVSEMRVTSTVDDGSREVVVGQGSFRLFRDE